MTESQVFKIWKYKDTIHQLLVETLQHKTSYSSNSTEIRWDLHIYISTEKQCDELGVGFTQILLQVNTIMQRGADYSKPTNIRKDLITQFKGDNLVN